MTSSRRWSMTERRVDGRSAVRRAATRRRGRKAGSTVGQLPAAAAQRAHRTRRAVGAFLLFFCFCQGPCSLTDHGHDKALGGHLSGTGRFTTSAEAPCARCIDVRWHRCGPRADDHGLQPAAGQCHGDAAVIARRKRASASAWSGFWAGPDIAVDRKPKLYSRLSVVEASCCRLSLIDSLIDWLILWLVQRPSFRVCTFSKSSTLSGTSGWSAATLLSSTSPSCFSFTFSACLSRWASSSGTNGRGSLRWSLGSVSLSPTCRRFVASQQACGARYSMGGALGAFLPQVSLGLCWRTTRACGDHVRPFGTERPSRASSG